MEARFTPAEQARLAASSVLVVGCGGLGSPVAYELAAAGVGRIGLCDMDRVDLSNLQRQVLHDAADVGRLKVESGMAKISALRPETHVDLHPVSLTSDNALELFAQYDLILDCSDNFATRYLVNDACVLAGRPQIHGSIFRFDGQVTTFIPGQGPCYRCIYPTPPPPGSVPSCAEAGVIGVLPGFVGSLMAMEALKVLSGRGAALVGRLLVYSALDMDVAEVQLRRNPDCPVCGDHPTIHQLIDYEQFCGGVGR
ncbi:adenylyltransferase/sulfurtransferase [Symbiobacterium terraclitae]|uniref:Adenylyltransferase/sulfurtransferase n=1 Tax=Symbiobacterium terraclitae TaxID=557451 RepID=A0ABS4JNU7_9FIRM|nr:ThiF family adenylyltransferase [Symbiobacterium terraclitae]MBP2017222.1 adenylyltransferase/sulfurtransferase [Symbiobacterium terraclitae]